MKFSLSNVLFAFLLVGFGIGWLVERRRAVELQNEIDRLETHLKPDSFAYRYHPNPERSCFAIDPLAEVDRKTGNLFKALATQPAAWSNGLNQYLGLDRIREDLDPKLTMTVWWHGEVKDAEGNRFFVYLADREREPNTKCLHRLHSSFSAYIVTDDKNTLLHWNGCEIDRLLVTEIELVGDTFPAGLKYREQSRHNGDSSIEVRHLTKSGITN
ncbi:LapA family protein [Bremerella volcania]|uniref:LapA family protein n=1 Tax=Bremerella volcania TaxID=2527984 RepID=UPI00119F11B8|nr:LapA family protein [Bremerella volcania]